MKNSERKIKGEEQARTLVPLIGLRLSGTQGWGRGEVGHMTGRPPCQYGCKDFSKKCGQTYSHRETPAMTRAAGRAPFLPSNLDVGPGFTPQLHH